jgi:invasion protein IalB
MYKYFTLIALAFLFFFQSYAIAEDSTSLGTYGEWEAMYWNTEEGLVCSIISAPIKKEGKYTKRGQVYAQISKNKGSKELGIVSFQAGYTFKTEKPVSVNIDSKYAFKLFTNNQTAWAGTEDEDILLIKSMKLGTKMVVKGISSRGTNTTDTYSLKGFIAAYKAMNKICK